MQEQLLQQTISGWIHNPFAWKSTS